MSNGVVGGTLLGVLSIPALMGALSSQPPFMPAALLPAGGSYSCVPGFCFGGGNGASKTPPPTKRATPSQGRSRSQERVAVKDGQVLTPPGVEAARRCVLYGWTLTRREQRVGETRTVIVSQGVKSVPFWVEDETGRVEIRPQDAKVGALRAVAARLEDGHTIGVSYLAEGDEVHAYGWAEPTDDGEVAVGGGGEEFVITRGGETAALTRV